MARNNVRVFNLYNGIDYIVNHLPLYRYGCTQEKNASKRKELCSAKTSDHQNCHKVSSKPEMFHMFLLIKLINNININQVFDKY